MKSLYDYEVLVNDTFYKSWHVLEYIEQHQNMSEEDKKAISATIMDALVYAGEIEPDWEYLDLDNCCISGDTNGYKYEIHPDIASIPMWLKDELRKKSINSTTGLPISIAMGMKAKEMKEHYVNYSADGIKYDIVNLNISLSSLFDDFSFYLVPDKDEKLNNRSMIEVNINGELYIVDVLSKMVYKSSYMAEKKGLIISTKRSKKDFNVSQMIQYESQCTESNILDFAYHFLEGYKSNAPQDAELTYEIEKSKEVFPEKWDKYKRTFGMPL